MTLHEWIYSVICDICYDREYVYASYVRHFSALLKEIFEQGRIVPQGRYVAHGMKSNTDAIFSWGLDRPTDMLGAKIVTIDCRIIERVSEKEVSKEVRSFELSGGESTKV